MSAYEGHGVAVHHGDCLDVLAELDACSVDSVVTDPPYDLTAGKNGGTGIASLNLASPAGRARISTGFMGKAWDGTGIAFDPETWRLVLRVLKPGGHLLAFGGPRTSHRLVCAIEDAGFEIRDSLVWMYGTGFPKSHDVSKAIDKAAGATREVVGFSQQQQQRTPAIGTDSYGDCRGQSGDITAPATADAQTWQGWGTALKPAHEPIVLARKPLDGTVAGNVLAHGTGALNVDGCRIGDEIRTAAFTSLAPAHGNRLGAPGTAEARRGTQGEPQTYVGRWPANVVLDETAAAMLDEQAGNLTPGLMRAGTRPIGARTTFGADASAGYETQRDTPGDSGGASRFFYTAKADAMERPRIAGVAHPTVKPLDLMRWLVRLVTPRGGLVLDPFAGSGTTVEACLLEGMRCVAIEREADYLPLIVARITRQRDPVAYVRLVGDETLTLFGGHE